jgi:hypothetical protein
MKNLSLSKFLTTPSKIAHGLDWKKDTSSLLTLSIYRDTMKITIANHPAYTNGSLPLVENIPLRFIREDNDLRLDQKVIGHFQNLIQSHHVCGFVIFWPLQNEGRIGAWCGRVLFTLDLLCLDSNSSIFSNNRKFCLWCNSKMHVETADEFGRCSSYVGSPGSNPNFLHVASRKQYNQVQVDDDTWDDFLQAHWPITHKESNVYSQNDFDWLFCMDQRTSLIQHATA